jgi:hypothetical protein
MSFLTNTALFIHKLEDQVGVAVDDIQLVPVTVRVRELDFSVETEKDDENSKYLTGDYAGNDESIIGKSTGSASYGIKVAPGQYNEDVVTGKHTLQYAPYLQNAGLTMTGVGVADTDENANGIYVFYPSSDNSAKTATVARVVKDSTATTGKYHLEILRGAMSNFSLSADGVGMPFTFKFDTQGAVEGVVAVEAITGLDEANIMRTVADNMLNTTVSITDLSDNSVQAFCINSATFDSGNELAEVECQDNEAGIRNYIITGMNPTLEIDPLLKTLGDFNYWTALNNERFYSVKIESEYLTLVIPRAQILNSSLTDANGFMRNTLNLRALRNIDKVDYKGTAGAGLAEAMYYIVIRERAKQY